MRMNVVIMENLFYERRFDRVGQRSFPSRHAQAAERLSRFS